MSKPWQRIERIGDATLSISGMFLRVGRTRQGFKVGGDVIHGVPIPVMHDDPLRYFPVDRFPVENGARNPYIGFADFDVSAGFSRFILSDRYGSYGKPLLRLSPRLVFCGGRKMDAFHSAIPWNRTGLKGISRPQSFTQRISLHPVMGHSRKSVFGVPYSTAYPRAKAGRSCTIGLDFKSPATYLTFLNHHVRNMAYLRFNVKSGTTDIACRRIRDAYAQPQLPLEEPPQAVSQELPL